MQRQYINTVGFPLLSFQLVLDLRESSEERLKYALILLNVIMFDLL